MILDPKTMICFECDSHNILFKGYNIYECKDCKHIWEMDSVQTHAAMARQLLQEREVFNVKINKLFDSLEGLTYSFDGRDKMRKLREGFLKDE